ncbi:MAG: phosphoribosylamine--glycine ligase [Phycisphaerae bacterium]|nr:phosphoribosylamine--glycine ligase [Phycisphaerae bacterium]
MKVLIVGSGGREHALAWKIAQSKLLKQLFCAPGNPGTAELAENVALGADDITELLKFAKGESIDLTVVGPEAPLAEGIVDAFAAQGLSIFGPSGEAAKIEADKAFCKQLLRSASVPTAEARIFDDLDAARKYISSRDEALVVKASGLAAGKGVFLCSEPKEALAAAQKIMAEEAFGDSGRTIVVEEMLKGQEASILALVDGTNIYVLESSQDHKAIGDGDTGPNTGGMGAYSPAPVVSEEVMAQVVSDMLVPTVDAMNRRGTPYRGLLYAGIMITPAGPKLLEYNCRFGDPETQPLMLRLKSDLLAALLAVCRGELDKVDLEWDPRPAVCVVMASGGYPGAYEKGKVIEGIDQADKLADTVVFHAGTAMVDGKLVTSGGRVLGVTALGDDIAQAKARAYEAVSKINFEGAYYRRDISDKALSG